MNGKTTDEQELTTGATTQDTGVGPFLGEALSHFARSTDQGSKQQLAELPDTKNIDAQIASFNQFLESASPLNEWHKNKILARFGEMPQPEQARMPQGAAMPQISSEASSKPAQPAAATDKPSRQQQAPAAQPATAPAATTPAQKQQYFLNPATGSYEPLQTTGAASAAGWNATIGTEFGKVDDPARGGYTEAGWNRGKWGGNIADTTTIGVALPQRVLTQYGNPNDANFANDFNSRYQVAVRDPATGRTAYASLQDYGPGPNVKAGIDLMWGTVDALGFDHDSAHNVEFQIVPRGSADVATTQ